MPTVVLRDAGGADIGFMLVAGSESFSAGPAERDLVLMKLPLPSGSPLAAFLDEHRHIEFLSNIQHTDAGISVSFQVTPALSVKVEVASSGAGTWSVATIGSGPCQVLAK